MTKLSPATQPLSPAAKAVLDAVFDHWPGGYNHPGKPRCVAAVIRAAVDQVVLKDVDPLGDWTYKDEVRYQFLAIATELENHK